MTPLHYSARDDHILIVEYLFNVGANIMAKDKHTTLFFLVELLFIIQLIMVK